MATGAARLEGAVIAAPAVVARARAADALPIEAAAARAQLRRAVGAAVSVAAKAAAVDAVASTGVWVYMGGRW